MGVSDSGQAGAIDWVRGELWKWEDDGESYQSLAERLVDGFLAHFTHLVENSKGSFTESDGVAAEASQIL